MSEEEFQPYITKQGRMKNSQPLCIRSQWFQFKSAIVHNNKYDYSVSGFTGTENPVIIICPEHGVFSQTARNHMKGRGCPKCAQLSRNATKTLTQEEFEARASQVHGKKYRYGIYKKQTHPIVVECPYHGQFSQYPHNHLAGNGCPKCQNKNQDTLYLLKCVTTGLIKIGITNNLSNRLCSLGGRLVVLHYKTLANPRYAEQELHQKYATYRVNNPYVKNGNTEFFSLTDQQVESIKVVINGYV